MPLKSITPSIKPRLQQLRPSATLVINELSSQLIKQGKKLYRFGFGQSPFPVPNTVVAALQAHAHEKAYLPVRGLETLRAAVANFNRRTLGIDSTSNNILIGPGSKELIYLTQLAFDGEILLPAPSWVSYQPQAQVANNKLSWLPCYEEDDWLLHPDVLNAACLKDPSTPKLLILNYPSNPTGASFNTNQLKALAKVASAHNILILADEIYAELHHNAQHVSIAKYYPEATIVSGGLSKWCGAGGWRLGTLSFPDELQWLQDIMATIASETYSTASAPIQHAAITAFNGNDEIENYLINSRKILKAVAQYVYQQLRAIGVKMPAPTGGFYLIPNFDTYRAQFRQLDVTNSKEMCHIILQETGVALLPGIDFGRPMEELTTRLAFVDFDGDALLKVLQDKPMLDVDDDFVKMYCPNIVEGIEHLSKWLTNLSP